jgi:hypothetical protein
MVEQDWFEGAVTDEAKAERQTLRERLLLILCAVCGLALLLLGLGG